MAYSSACTCVIQSASLNRSKSQLSNYLSVGDVSWYLSWWCCSLMFTWHLECIFWEVFCLTQRGTGWTHWGSWSSLRFECWHQSRSMRYWYSPLARQGLRRISWRCSGYWSDLDSLLRSTHPLFECLSPPSSWEDPAISPHDCLACFYQWDSHDQSCWIDPHMQVRVCSCFLWRQPRTLAINYASRPIVLWSHLSLIWH